MITLSQENYKTHDFEDYKYWGNKKCKICGLILFRGWVDNSKFTVRFNLSCDEYIIKNIIE